MSRNKTSQNTQTTKSNGKNRRGATKKSVSLPFRYRLLMLACGAVLVAGFFFAARQHFASVDFSMRNSKLRKMSEELEADKRRLLLAKEIALSPAELKKAAQKIGFTTTTKKNADSATTTAKTEKPRAEKSELAKLKQATVEKAGDLVAEVKPLVKKFTETKAPDLRERRAATQTER